MHIVFCCGHLMFFERVLLILNDVVLCKIAKFVISVPFPKGNMCILETHTTLILFAPIAFDIFEGKPSLQKHTLVDNPEPDKPRSGIGVQGLCSSGVKAQQSKAKQIEARQNKASQQASQQASKQASKEARQPGSQAVSKRASFCTCLSQLSYKTSRGSPGRTGHQSPARVHTSRSGAGAGTPALQCLRQQV